MIEKYDHHKNNFIRSSIIDEQDPLFLTFGIRFEFGKRSNPGESLEPGLLSGNTRRYLSSRGDTLRVQKLDYFQTALKKFSIDEPWWFTKIGGLDGLLNIKLSNKSRIGDGAITIYARESLDMKFLSMIESYRSLVYDKIYMRETLPGNLKRFDMSIFITDVRILVGQGKDDKEVKYNDDKQGVIVLKLYDCEFDFSGHGNFLSSVQNEKTGEVVTHSFVIKAKRIYEEYNLPTGFLFGYAGNGYFSDDAKSDFNFVTNVLRPKAMLLAEMGNERKIREEDYAEYIKRKRLEITSLDMEIEKIPIKLEDVVLEETPQDSTLTNTKLEFTASKDNMNLNDLILEPKDKPKPLNPTILDIIQTPRRNIL